MTQPLKQLHIDWLLSRDVSRCAIIEPWHIGIAHGRKSKSGIFEEDLEGPAWFVFADERDIVYWNPKDGAIACDTGRAFALGEYLIDDPSVTAFDRYLNIYAAPLHWLQNERRGLVVLNWSLAFDKLRDVSRIAVVEQLLPIYRKMMRPQHMPILAVLPKAERRAA